MDCIRVCGGCELYGDVSVSGSKNSVLPILAATLINSGENIINNCPLLSDVFYCIDILKSLGCKVELEGNTVYVNSECIDGYSIDEYLMNKLRASVIFASCLLLRTGKAEFCVPGGCKIGMRPIDIHLAAFEKMGVDVECNDGNVKCKVNSLKGEQIYLPFPSVGATENVMLLALGADGETKIYNAAKEPEIVDLQNFLNSIGAKVSGAGTNVITVRKSGPYKSSLYTVMADRIETVTFVCACAIAGGDILIRNCEYEYILRPLSVLGNMGVCIIPVSNGIRVVSNKKLKCPDYISTMPYPGFPTDAQSLLMSVMSCSDGVGVIVENVFENRLNHAFQLIKMGAEIRVTGNKACVHGKKLHGADIESCDLRSGAALVVAGLGCDDLTTVFNCCYIDRGYEKFEHKLRSLGADIERKYIC